MQSLDWLTQILLAADWSAGEHCPIISSHFPRQVSADSVYDKLRMFNGGGASWAWYGATPTPTHLGLHTAPPTHPALTHPFPPRELPEDKKPGEI